jgi:hypothetical protein
MIDLLLFLSICVFLFMVLLGFEIFECYESLKEKEEKK